MVKFPTKVHVMKRPELALALATLVAATTAAHAETRVVLRLGVEPLSLEPSADTPYVGDHVEDAVTAYNAASTAYNRAHGYAPGSAMASAPIDRSALGLHATLLTFAPGVELGGEHVKVRAEGLLGIADQVRAFGVGLYPIDLSLPIRGSRVTPYFVAGGTLRWLDRSGTEGETGGLVTMRAAAGARIGRRVVVELGVGLFMLGGLYNDAELRSMADYDPRGNAPPPPPERAVSGGTQTGMVDISLGFVL
jgi:hypothetical protein